jgi:hypothetical protein
MVLFWSVIKGKLAENPRKVKITKRESLEDIERLKREARSINAPDTLA